MENYFVKLNSINVNDKTEKKNGLTYLSWAWAWGEVKKIHPDATYTIYERDTEYGPVNYFTDGRTCWVKTGVTIGGIEHIEDLPVMDFKNNSIPLDKVTSYDVNKAIQRSLTKACARHGLGLYIYAGEDLPEDDKTEEKPAPTAKKAPVAAPPGAPKYEPPKEDPPKKDPPRPEMFVCNRCGKKLTPYLDKNGKEISVRQHAMGCEKKWKEILCLDCIHEIFPESIKV